jgi:hypothetical protein
MEHRCALVVSPTPAARAAEERLRASYEFVSPAEADLIIALGGDGFMLQVLHQMLESHVIKPVFGMNLGTVGFLMNEWRLERLDQRLGAAKPFKVNPLRMHVTTVDGTDVSLPAINEVSLLRETRQTAKLEVSSSTGASRMDELAVRRRAGRHARRFDRLQPFRQRADPAARLRNARADADQPVPPPALARRHPAGQHPKWFPGARIAETPRQRGRRPEGSARYCTCGQGFAIDRELR